MNLEERVNFFGCDFVGIMADKERRAASAGHGSDALREDTHPMRVLSDRCKVLLRSGLCMALDDVATAKVAGGLLEEKAQWCQGRPSCGNIDEF